MAYTEIGYREINNYALLKKCALAIVIEATSIVQLKVPVAGESHKVYKKALNDACRKFDDVKKFIERKLGGGSLTSGGPKTQAQGTTTDGPMFINKFGKIYLVPIINLLGLKADQEEHALFYFTAHFLDFNSRLSGRASMPKAIYNRTSHLTNLTEIIDLHLAKSINPKALPIGTSTFMPGINLTEIVAQLADFITHILSLENLRTDIARRFGQWCCHLAYKVKVREELTAFEKTMLLYSMTSEFWGTEWSPEAGENTHFTLNPAKDANVEANIADLLDTIKANFVLTPYNKMSGLITTSSYETLKVYQGAWTPNLIVSQGYTTPFGSFSEMHFTPNYVIDWPATELVDWMMTYIRGGSRLNESSIISYSYQTLGNLNTQLDDSDVALRLYQKNDSIMYEYYMRTLDRQLTTNQTEPYLVNKALEGDIIQQAQIKNQSLDNFNVLDFSTFKNGAYGLGVGADKAIVDKERITKFIYYSPQSSGSVLKVKTAGLKAMMNGGGEFISPCNGKEYVASILALEKPQPEIASYLQGYLGLTNAEMIKSTRILELQYNAWFLRYILGADENKLPFLTTNKVIERVEQLTNLKMSAAEKEKFNAVVTS